MRWVSHFVEGFHAAPLERVSIRSLAEQGSPQEDQYRVQQGYGALVDYLGRDARVHGARIEYLRPVHEILTRPSGVEVRSGGETWQASTAIVALPLSIVRAAADAGGMRFDPRPAWLDALVSGYAMGEAQRLVVRLREPLELHTDLPGGAFLHVLGAEVPTFWLAGDESAPQVTAWCGGPRAATWASSADRLGVALASLGAGLGKSRAELEPLVLDAHTHDFARDPRARGAYPYRLAERDAPNEGPSAGRPPLLLAGDFFEGSALGTVGAAVQSGFAAARTVLALA
jgi:monoamine oxidase